MKRKLLAILLAMSLCMSATACAGEPEPETTQPSSSFTETTAPTLPTTEETVPVTYTYEASPMQGVARCAYYPYGSTVPISYDPATLWGSITVWTQCPRCGDEGFGIFRIDPAELNFSLGDTLQYSGTDSCFDCSWDYDMDQFMWVISVTRIPE